ncbi:hypothetical protein G6F24_015279 [Rhizopus arrhizus]|nr:hypothetical protein G6F24_015279 [Rhizopus arrhizus]
MMWHRRQRQAEASSGGDEVGVLQQVRTVSAAEGGQCLRAGDAIGDQSMRALEGAHRVLGGGAEVAVLVEVGAGPGSCGWPQQGGDVAAGTEDQQAQQGGDDGVPDTDRWAVEQDFQAADGHGCAEQAGEQRDAAAEAGAAALVADQTQRGSDVGQGGDQRNGSHEHVSDLLECGARGRRSRPCRPRRPP